MNKFKIIQLTNSSVGLVSVDTYMPLGIITRRINPRCQNNCDKTFTVSSTGTNTVTINECGYYKVLYSASVVASAAGIVTLSLQLNSSTVYSVSVTAAQGDTVNLTLPFELRVLPNCPAKINNIPVNVQVLLTGVALTDGTTNFIIERNY
jgi:hypothetical protein